MYVSYGGCWLWKETFLFQSQHSLIYEIYSWLYPKVYNFFKYLFIVSSYEFNALDYNNTVPLN